LLTAGSQWLTGFLLTVRDEKLHVVDIVRSFNTVSPIAANVTVSNVKAQIPPVRSVVDLLYSLLHNKPAANPTGGV